MSKMQLAVEITFNKTGTGADAAVKSVKLIDDSTKKATRSADELRRGWESVGKAALAASTAAVAVAAWKGFDALKDMVTAGIEFNATLENSKLGMGALISSMTNIESSTRGALHGTEKLNAAMVIAGDIQKELQVMALKTSATYEDMVSAMGVALGPALKGKMDLAKGEIQKFVLAVTQMAGAVDQRLLQNGQLNQEIRGILEGDTSKNSRLSQILYGDLRGGDKGVRKRIKDLQDEGKFYDFVMEKMKAYSLAGERAGKTFSGAMSNLKDAFQQALGAGTQGQFGNITKLLLDLTEKIVTFDEAGKATFNPEFVRSINDITTAFMGMAKAVGDLTDKLPGLITYAAQLASPDIWTKIFALSGASAGGALGFLAGGPTGAAKGAVVGGTAMYAYGGWQQKELLDSTNVQGANTGVIADTERRLANINKYLMYLKQLSDSGDAGVKAWAAGEADFTKSVIMPRRADAVGAKFDTRFWEAATTGEKFTATPPKTPPVIDAKAEAKAKRLKDAIDDLTASSKIFGEEQERQANKAAFEGLVDKEEAALRKLDSQRQISAAGFATMIAQTSDPIRKLELERSESLDAMANDAERFSVDQSKALLQLRSALQGLDDEVTKFQAKQDKQLQDLMQRGVKFGSAGYQEAVAAQDANLKALTERQVEERTNLNAKIQNLDQDQTEFERGQAAERAKIMAESGRAISDQHFDQLTARLDAEREFQEEVLQSTRSFTKRMRDQYAGMADQIGTSIRDGIKSLLEGGDLQDAMQGMADFFNGMIAESFGGLFDSFFAKMAAHAAGQPGPGEVGPPSPTQQRNANLGMMGIQGASALYGLYTNPAPKQSQNMLQGAMMGASIGATYGAGIASVYGAIIGAFLGAIAGAFAPTEKGKNVKIIDGGTGGTFSITGMDSDWGAAKLRRSINQAVSTTAASLDAIFLGLPTAALAAMANWRPDLSSVDVTGKADGKNWNEELDDYLKNTLPKKVFDAYGGSIATALRFAGVTEQRIRELTATLKNGDMTTEEAIKALSDYVSVIYGLKDIMDMFGGQPSKKGRQRSAGKGGNVIDAGERFTQGVYERADAGPLAAYEKMSARLSVLSQGFDDLTHEEQVARGQQILDLSQQFFSGVEEYLLKLRESQKALNESLDAQSREITLDQITDPKLKVEFLLAEQRRYRDQLMKATTADETNRIAGLMQQNIGDLYTLLGKTPEAAKQMQDQIADIKKIADERYKTFADAAEKMAKAGFELVEDILKKLQAGLGEIIDGKTPGDGTADPDGPRGPRNRDDAYDEVIRFGAAATIGADGLTDGFTPGIADATAKLLQFSAALSAPIVQPTINVTVQIGAPEVSVSLSGGAEHIISVAEARAKAGAVKEVFTTLGQQQARYASTGRR